MKEADNNQAIIRLGATRKRFIEKYVSLEILSHG
jgi:hypothetical protein